MTTKAPLKTTKKKVVKKKTTKAPLKYEYTIVAQFNDEVHTFETNDIRESLLSVKPQFLKTRVLLSITKGERTLEKMYYAQHGRQLFINRYAMDALLKNLIF